MERERIAAIDIGSDTVHVLVADVSGSTDGPVVSRVSQRGELLELGRQIETTGQVGRSAAARLEASLLRCMGFARRKSGRVIVGATEALRRATDGAALVERLSREAGEPVRVLSGSREAALGLAGEVHRLDPAGSQLLIDSGGASTELTITEGRRAVASASLPVGAALLGAELRGDPPEALSWALAGARIGTALSLAPAGKPARAWATGGSAHNLAGLERTRSRSGDRLLTREDLSKLAARLLAERARKLARGSGEDPARVKILPPGVLIIATILAHYDLDEVTVVPEGLRDGMVGTAFELGDAWWEDQLPNR
jgi:exopolyphosphatase/guanosine-5'-triphosphate,3'-diphosphate pyrophosphatase